MATIDRRTAKPKKTALKISKEKVDFSWFSRSALIVSIRLNPKKQKRIQKTENPTITGLGLKRKLFPITDGPATAPKLPMSSIIP
ncbi:hypothetical protein SDC9_191251 [bioreactor metagenome]|uniref:Uncharacterized protein n=1 Tax=bioreactor metagenome TaxID=1076179 RepID=A0A645HXD6_9ZZZZ